ncbi:Txe/YoeB family addiction module toxin [Chroococcus sp. FPU101]|uniref:Txe/YoeB family addiction module toxin n=1 Tax=Chroococcus sp. FPU101 TaxID=1974212 RepID=UPI001A8C4507|nr:Txe/YoeB family addiction module toxin [Chroococcus sp. FPU101]GFE71485.1 putative addiction module toxin, Txe/YoeB [Chroococcus sp. FPU101]
MNLIFSDDAWDDYLYWPETDRKTLKKINALIKEIKRTPFEGTGKPEALRYEFSEFWSRRINDEHRIVYKVEENAIFLIQMRYHYLK